MKLAPQHFAGYDLLWELPSQRYISSYLAKRTLDSRGPEFVIHVQDDSAPDVTDWGHTVGNLVSYDHPRILRIIEIGAIQGRVFVVTPYVEGRHLLQAWVRHGDAQAHVPLEICAQLAIELCRAIVEAPGLVADLGFVPVTRADVLVSSKGEVKLDIGVACLRRRAAQGAAHLKMNLSPEELRGCRPDSKSAVYAVGIVLWEFLTGQMLFPIFGRWIPLPRRRERDADIGKRPFVGVIHPSYLREDIPDELNLICVRALKTNPRRRFEGCEEFADDLERFLAHRGWRDGPTRLAEYIDQWFASDFAREREQRAALLPWKPNPPSA